MNTTETDPSLCPIPGRYFGKPWRDLPDNALHYALAAAHRAQSGARSYIDDSLDDAHLDALMSEMARRAGLSAPTSPAPTPAPEPSKRGRGRPRIHPPKPVLSETEKAERRIAAAKKAGAASAAVRKANAAHRQFQAVSIDVEVLEHLRSTSVLVHKPLSTTLEMALNSLDAVSYMTPECVRIFEDICAKTREEPDKLLKRILTEFESRLG